MKALMKTAPGVGNMELRDMPEPFPGPGRVKIAVEYTGICGSDLKIVKDLMATDPPVITGHEFAGVIAEVGEGVTSYKVGDRVVSETAAEFCGVCEYCMSGNYLMCPSRRSLGYKENGAFAKYAIARQDMLHIIPDEVSFEEAAMTEPSAVAFHAVYDYARLLPTSRVLVIGPGTIGLLVTQMVLNAVPRVAVCGLTADAPRLELAKKFGADTAFMDKDDIDTFAKKFTEGRKFDFVFDCTGAPPAISSALKLLRNSGTLVQVGLTHGKSEVDYGRIAMSELTVRGVYGSKYPNWVSVLQLMRDKKIDLKSMISGVYDLDHWEEAFGAAAEPQNVKVLIRPQ
ncbi:MAG: zinc-binding dehydrogenase [Lachnospiraceae bacterium]|nr:zinc-binding dehydrogenase [Lachnospiraceae bacterium]